MEFVILKENEGQTIKEFLREKHISAGLLKRLKKIENGITVNSVHQNVTYRLMENDILSLQILMMMKTNT